MPRTRRRRAYYIPLGCVIPLALSGLVIATYIAVLIMATRSYGPPTPTLGPWQRFQYSVALLWYNGLVTRPAAETLQGEQIFVVSGGEQAATVAERLEQAGLIRSAGAFRAYLIYTGLDTSLQAGQYTFSAELSPVQIAERLQDATPSHIRFVVLPGWRMEEIAESLPTSGLEITPEAFLAAAHRPSRSFDFLPAGASAEGFLLPDQYTLPRVTRAEDLVDVLLRRFEYSLSPKMRDGFSRRNLSIYQAVTLASIVEREAVEEDEKPIIASVFLNRLEAGMHLGADPTVQYALGFDPVSQSWWRAPLSLDNLAVASPYNTYDNLGLPPGPIANPSLSALRAVASPAETNYLFFRARCDGSRRHTFSETFDQHLEGSC